MLQILFKERDLVQKLCKEFNCSEVKDYVEQRYKELEVFNEYKDGIADFCSYLLAENLKIKGMIVKF